MATNKELEQFVEILKFTPMTVNVQVHGYGGECYMGRVKRETYEFFKEHRIDVEQLASDWDDDGKWNFIPDKHRIFPPGEPYECENICHSSGATLEDSFITIEGPEGTIFESTLNPGHLEDQKIVTECVEEIVLSTEPQGQVIFWGGQGEKGSFFDSELTLRAPFDPSKLKISYADLDGWLILQGIEYNGEELEGQDGYSTTGKWSEHKFIINGAEEVYEGVERDSDGEECTEDDVPLGANNGPEVWERSPRITKGNPIRAGWYDCCYNTGTTFGTLYWTGSEWWDYQSFQPTTVNKVTWWSGYNWDTTDWSNRPPVPPRDQCTQCGFVGEIESDSDHVLVCPDCGAQDADIVALDYDPQTKLGRDTRKKYCKPKPPEVPVPQSTGTKSWPF